MILTVYLLVVLSAILFSVVFWYFCLLVLAPKKKARPNYSPAVDKLLKLPCDYEK